MSDLSHRTARHSPVACSFVLRLLTGLAAAFPASGFAAQPGLIMRTGDADARVVRQVALYVPKGGAVSAFRGAAAPVRAVFEGTLNLEARSRLIFTLEGNGSAQLTVDGEILCGAIGVPSELKRLSSGEHPIRIEFAGPAAGDAQLRLFWAGRDFISEPVPASAFSHDELDPALAEPTQRRLGHELIADHRCSSCHGDGGKEAQGSPSLTGIGNRLEAAWLADWIENPRALRPSARMPVLFKGEGARQKAVDIAVYLAGAGAVAEEAVLGEPQVKRGGELFYEQGCVGCHTLGAVGDGGRIGLGEIARKFRPGALAGFLREPAKHHADTRMPEFGFDEAEGRALEAFLRTLAKPVAEPELAGDPARGALLFRQSGCLNCHQSGELASGLAKPQPATAAGCSAADFCFGEAERAAIAAALANPRPPAPVPAEIAQRQFVTLRCAACHERDGQPAYREAFAGEVAHLQPAAPAGEDKPGAHGAKIPQLDHLGMKLRPDWRTSLFNGEVQPKIRPWLQARMPAFRSRAEVLSVGFSHAAGLPVEPAELPVPDAAKVAVGAALTGLTGLACGTCHAIGEQAAIAVFEGEGPNFRWAGRRLREEYFSLWMSDPARQWPGTIMPKYATDGLTPLTQHYDGDAAKQFDAMFDYIRSLAN